MSYNQQQQYGGGGPRYEQQQPSSQQQYGGYGQSSYGQQQGGGGGGGYDEYSGNPYSTGQQQQQPQQQYGGQQQAYGGQQQPQQQQYGGQQQAYGGQQQNRPVAQEQGSSNYGRQNASQQQGYEMTNMNQTNSSDPNFILNECRAVERAVDELEQRDLEQLKAERQRYLNDFQQDNAAQVKKMEDLWTRIHATYQTLIRRMGVIKGMEASGEPRNSPSVGKADRRIKTSLNRAQQIEREHREKAREQFERQYRIVRPDASAAEVREAEESSDQQVFSSALMQSDRRGNASQVVNSVKARHLDIQNIEKQMMELAQLFQDLETLVVQQEPAVAQIEQKGEEVNDHVSKANVELDGAVKKAAAARRKKWICLGIAVTIVIIIVVVVVVVVEVVKK